MSDFIDNTRAVIPPMVGGGNLEPQRLADTGTTESSNSRRLVRGRMHELIVGGAPIGDGRRSRQTHYRSFISNMSGLVCQRS